MSIIQTLRGKGSVVVTVMLILALVAFIFMDSFQNRSLAMFDADRTMVAEVNGERIETQVYTQKLQEFEENMKANQKVETFTDEQMEQLRGQFWDQELTTVLIGQETEKLGLEVTETERNSMFTSMDPDPAIRQNFTDPATGIFDPQQVIQREQQIMQGDDANMKKQWGKFKEELVKQRKVTKYVSLIKQGIYVPKFMLDDMAKQQNIVSSLEFVKIPYETINAQSITVTDAEIKDYLSKHAASYTNEEDALNIEYVSFPVVPTAKDSAATLKTLTDVQAGFAASAAPYDFASDQSDELTDDRFYNATTLTNANKEVLLAATIGQVVGPYYDNGMYKLSRVTERKSLPDSVRASHILIQPSETLTDAQAKEVADSLEKQVNAGVSIAALQASSADKPTAEKGGDLGFFSKGMMVPEFEKFSFDESVGTVGVVKSQFGYHVIKITDQKAFQPSVRIATLGKLLAPSQETSSRAQQAATDFVSKATNEKTFNEAAKKLGQDKRMAQNIKPTQGVVQGLGNVRNLVRWAYESELGDISPVLNFEDKIIVARLVSKTKKGELADITTARAEIEGKIRQQKQYDQIAAKAKSATSLQAIAGLFAGTEIKTADSIRTMSMSHPELGFESKVLGAATNKNNLNKLTGPIGGQAGVYYITVKTITDEMKTAPRMEQMERMQVQGQYMQSIDQFLPMVLRKKANITDNRSVSLNY